MGFFSRLLGNNKDEDEVVRPPVRTEASRVTGAPPPPPPSTPEEKAKIRDIVSRSLDEFADTFAEMVDSGKLESGEWQAPARQSVPSEFCHFTTPYTDKKGNLLPDTKGVLLIGAHTWGGFDPDWDTAEVANRYYESFPRDINEIKQHIMGLSCQDIPVGAGDDALYVKALQAVLAYNTDNIDKEVSKILPKGPESPVAGDGEGVAWYLNGDGIAFKQLPEIDDMFNWIAALRCSAAEIKKDIGNIEDGVLRTMLLNYLDEQNDLDSRIFMRFSGCGQRVQKLRELFVVMNGQPKRKDGIITHELSDYETVRKDLLHYVRIYHAALDNGSGRGRKGTEVENEEEYYIENRDFSSTSLSMRRVAAILAVCYCITYARDNLRAYLRFVLPVVQGSRDRHIADIKNYLSFRNHTDDTEPGKKYWEVFQKVMDHTTDRLNEIKTAMGYYLLEYTNITHPVAYGAMYIARTHEPDENRLRWLLSDAINRRMDPIENIPICTPEFQYFVPWSVKPGELLEIGGIRGGQQGPGGAR